MSVLPANYRAVGLSREALHAYGQNRMRYPNKFVPAIPCVFGIGVLAASGADIANGDTLTLVAAPGVEGAELTFHKSGGAPANPITIVDGDNAIEIAAAILAAIVAEPLSAALFDAVQESSEVVLRNTYNDPLGFNLAGAAGNIACTGTALDVDKLVQNAPRCAGRNFTPGYIYVPLPKNRWAPAIHYPASLQP